MRGWRDPTHGSADEGRVDKGDPATPPQIRSPPQSLGEYAHRQCPPSLSTPMSAEHVRGDVDFPELRPVDIGGGRTRYREIEWLPQSSEHMILQGECHARANVSPSVEEGGGAASVDILVPSRGVSDLHRPSHNVDGATVAMDTLRSPPPPSWDMGPTGRSGAEVRQNQPGGRLASPGLGDDRLSSGVGDRSFGPRAYTGSDDERKVFHDDRVRRSSPVSDEHLHQSAQRRDDHRLRQPSAVSSPGVHAAELHTFGHGGTSVQGSRSTVLRPLLSGFAADTVQPSRPLPALAEAVAAGGDRAGGGRSSSMLGDRGAAAAGAAALERGDNARRR